MGLDLNKNKNEYSRFGITRIITAGALLAASCGWVIGCGSAGRAGAGRPTQRPRNGQIAGIVRTDSK